MKLWKTIAALLTLFVIASPGHAQSEDLEELFKSNCSELIQSFGNQAIAADYTNWQGTATKNKLFNFRIKSGRCVSLSEIQSVVLENIDVPDLSASFFGTYDASSGFTFSSTGTASDLGSCPYVGANRAISNLTNAGVVVTPSIRTAIEVNYRNEVCPAIYRSLEKKLTQIAAEVVARKLQELQANRGQVGQ